LAMMLIVVIIAVFDTSAKTKDDGKMTVALIENNGFSVVSANPVVVKKGEPVSFDIIINENYFFRETEGVEYKDGTLTFSDITSSRNIYFNLGHNCHVTVEDTENGTVELIGDSIVTDGNKSSVKIVADEHYEIGSITVNGKEYPPVGGEIFEFVVEDDSEVKVNFIGEPVNFMPMSNNLGTIVIENQVDEYHYGDVIVLDCQFPENINFNGWSKDGFIDDGGTLIQEGSKWEYTITEDTILYANFKDTTIYNIFFNGNSGVIKKNIDMECSPNVYVNLPVDEGKITRTGYMLVGYNTAADGSGESYQLGEMIIMPQGDLELYAVWMKYTEAAAFDYTVTDEGVIINGLSATAGNVTELCIPQSVKGTKVIAIADNAFKDIDTVETIVVATGIQRIGKNAFGNCDKLTTVYLPETLTSLSNTAFSGSGSFKNLRVVATKKRVFDYDYDSIMADKYMKLKYTEGKRIILVGGSNLTFGINSVMLKERFSDYEIINFSGSYHNGVVTLFELLKANIHEGDVVIFCPEYYNTMYGETEPDKITNWQYIESNYGILKDIDIRNTPVLLSNYVPYLTRKTSLLPGKLKNSDSVYIRSGINSYGDLTVFRKNKVGEKLLIPDVSIITDAGMNRYNSIFKELSDKGATCLFTFPSIHGNEDSKEYVKTNTQVFMETLRAKIDSDYCTILSDCAGFSFASGLFYDSQYHLTLEGAKARTEVLIRNLEEFGLK